VVIVTVVVVVVAVDSTEVVWLNCFNSGVIQMERGVGRAIQLSHPAFPRLA